MFQRLYNLLRQPAIATSLMVTAALMGVQKTGMLQPFELKVWDQMTDLAQVASGQTRPDPRLLVVAVTEQDLQNLGQFPLSDRTLANVLQKLERHQPRVIGVDILRDLPIAPGHQELQQQLAQSDRTIVICKHANADNPAIPAPSSRASDQVGFSDIVEDQDGVIRRNLLWVTPPPQAKCSASASLGWQLVRRYLGTSPTWTSGLQWGQAQFQRLTATTGGYQLSDQAARGYQILLKYRAPLAQQVSLTDVLNDRVDPNLVKDRIVLIGVTAPSVKDIFTTPLTISSNPQTSRNPANHGGKMAGILLHAQMTSQLLDAVTTGRSLIWVWPDWAEWLWAGTWSLVGGGLVWQLRRPRSRGFGIVIAMGSLVLIHGVIFNGVILGGVVFSQSGWVPLAPPLFGFGLTSLGVIAYAAAQSTRQQQQMVQQLQEQAQTIAMLQALLQQTGRLDDDTIATMETIADPAAVPSGLLQGRYRITTLLGKGGFSHTYLAADTQLTTSPEQPHRSQSGHPLCVVKHLRPARSDEQFLKLARRLFKAEADILRLLGQHPQIPQLLAYFEEQQEFYLVQEYIPGASLEAELNTEQPLPANQVMTLLAEVLHILVFVHGHGVIHRDLKPSNLIRRHADNHIAMIDFGAVKQIHPQPREADNFTVAIGTVGYAPPEQFIGQPRLNSDLYALGMIAIQALTGVPAKQLQRDAETGELLWQHLASVDQPLAAVIDRMVAYNFHQRYQSATAVLQALAKLA
jgi:CHASE2 domain-containing sensor protein/predicted Ser/Thr protein kinase